MPAGVIGASIGMSLLGGAVSSRAAGKASKQQVAASDKAQQFNQQVYNDQRKMTEPYVTAGTSALNRLMGSYGQPYNPGNSYGGTPTNGPQPTSLSRFAAPHGMQSGGGMGAAMVTLRAPTGETMQLPDGDPRVQGYMAHGAQRVN